MITKAALLTFRGSGRRRALLFVKPKSKAYWIFPGGQREPGEKLRTALRREIQEELQTNLASVKELTVVQGRTPEGTPLRMHLFCGTIKDQPKPSGEIGSIKWVTKSELPGLKDELTPITVRKVLPLLEARDLW